MAAEVIKSKWWQSRSQMVLTTRHKREMWLLKSHSGGYCAFILFSTHFGASHSLSLDARALPVPIPFTNVLLLCSDNGQWAAEEEAAAIRLLSCKFIAIF